MKRKNGSSPTHKSYRYRLIVLAALAAPCVSIADTAYVSDKLVIGVFPEAGQETNKVASLETGDSVEILERADKYVRVKLTDGREGWAKASYFTSQPPAIVRLKELQASGGTSSASAPTAAGTDELRKLRDENTQLQSQINSLKEANKSASEQLAAAQAAAANKGTQPVAVQQPEASATSGKSCDPQSDSSAALDEEHGARRLGLEWVALAVVAAGALGFWQGFQLIARRIRRKYGSVKIY